MRCGLAVVAGATILAMGATSTFASPNGVWLRPKSGAHVQVFNCGGGLGMKIIKAAAGRGNTKGKTIMCGAKPDGANKWRGSLLSTEDGNTYTGILTLTGSKSLKLEGCVLGGIICQSESWSRIR